MWISLQYFDLGHLEKHIFISDLSQAPSNFLLITIFSKPHLLLKLTFTSTELWQRPKFDIFQKPDVIMRSSRLFESDIMFSTGCGSLFSDKTYTTVVFMSFRMSAFIFGVCFSTSIYFSLVFNKIFQHTQMIDFYPCCLFLL